jgi:hypothetical protein
VLIWLLACNPDDVVVHNDPPELSIVSPVDRDEFTEGFVVPFEVIVNDDLTPLDELTTLWVSDRDGELEGDTLFGERLLFETDDLSRGEHHVTVLATDSSGGVGETSILLTILGNTAPVLAFTEPASGSAIADGAQLVATLRVTDDTEPDLSAMALEWWLDGELVAEAPDRFDVDGTATLVLEGVALGDHELAASATDTPGLVTGELLLFSVLLSDADGDGHVTDRLGGGDCDDSDPAVNPDAVEVCDDLDTDEDCSGYADDDDPGVTDAELRYVDNDSDGYGASEVVTCEPESAAAADGDCDDADPAVNPAATEVCNDGVDNDCDGSSSGCRLGGDLDLYAADVLVYGVGSSHELGYSVAAADLDGDGLDDLAIGARRLDGGDADSGALVVVHSGGFGELYADEVGFVWEGTDDQGYAGTQVTTLDDLNGDGLAEVLIGAPQNDPNGSNSGQAFLLYGPLTLDGSLASADAVFDGEASSDNAGAAVAAAGDVDGDGLPDLLIGAPEEGSAHTQGGAGYLFLGPVTGSWSLADADGKFRAEAASDHLGGALTGVGDTNGDGYDDMLIGARDEDEAGSASGAAYLMLGDTTSGWSALSLSMSAADAKLMGNEAGVGAGEGLHGPGDLDGDGCSELLIGAWNADFDSGRIHLLYGPVAGTLDLGAVSDTTWQGSGAYQKLGFVITSGDFDADGIPDLLTGLPDRNSGASNAGSAGLLYGPWGAGTLDFDDVADGWVNGTSADQHTGFAVAAGDLDGDGKDDVIVGSPDDDTAATNGGMVSVVFGRGQ